MNREHSTRLFQHAIIVTVNDHRDVYFDGSLAVTGNRISKVGPTGALMEELRREGCFDAGNGNLEVIDCSGKIIFPGFISTHNHLFQTLFKGCGDDMVLADWLETMTFPASAHLTPEDTYYAAMIGLLDGIHSGITTQFDYMYAHPMEGLTDPVIDAFLELGVRGVLGRGGMDIGASFGVDPRIMQTTNQVEKDLVRLFDKYHMKHGEMMRIWTAPAAPWSSSDEMLRMLWEMTQHYRTGFSCHISETPFDRDAVYKTHGMTELDYLESRHMVGPNVMMVHSVYLTPQEIKVAAHHGMSVSHNTASNMYLSSGVAPIPAMLEAGLVVSLGLDGAASNNGQDMIELMKLTALLQKVHTLDPTVISAEKVLEMATIEGARALNMEDQIGSLEAGKLADLVVFNPLLAAKAIPMHNPVSTLVYSATENNVEQVIIDGKDVLKDGIIVTLEDEQKTLAAAQAQADHLAMRAGITNRRQGHVWNNTYRW